MHTSDIRKLISNFTFLSGGEVAGKILTFAAFTFLARVLGPRHFGYLEFTIALLVFFSLMTDSGTSTFGAREIAGNKKRIGELTANIVALRFLLATGGYLLLILLTRLLPSQVLPAGPLILIYGVTLFGSSGFLQWIFQGMDRMKRVAAGSLLRQTVFTAGVLVFIRREEQFWQVGWIECAATSALVLYNLYSLRPHLRNLHLRFDLQSAKQTFLQAFPIGLSEISWALNWYLPAILLGWMAGPRLVGWFSAASRPVIALHTFVWLYFYNLLPSMSRASKEGGLHPLFHRSMQIAGWSAVLTGMAGTILAGPAIQLVYGPEYERSVPIFRILIWLVPVALISGHYRYSLIAAGLQKYEMFTSVITAVVNLLLNRILIVRMGLPGAAIALLAASLINWILAYAFVRQKIGKIPVAASIIRPILGGLSMGIVFFFLMSVNLWLAFGASLLTFAVLFFTLQPQWKKLVT